MTMSHETSTIRAARALRIALAIAFCATPVAAQTNQETLGRKLFFDTNVSSAFRPFSSKYDAVKNGRAVFTAEEQLGESLFTGRATCSVCHVIGSRSTSTVFTGSWA